MKSTQSHTFSQVPKAEIPRSQFDRSSGHKTTFETDYLVPIFIDEALPGDTFNMNATFFARLATPLHPIMDNMHMDVFWFACPIRLLWTNWEKFNGEQDNPGDSTDFLVPQVTAPASTGFAANSLFDYFALPTGVTNISVAAFWSRMYNLTFNQWFRDQNLIDSAVVDKDDGPDDPADYVLRKRCKAHDYFTSGLPFAQKAQPVQIPLGGNAPLIPSGLNAPGKVRNASDGALYGGATVNIQAQTGTSDFFVAPIATFYDPNGTLVADLTAATGATINALRQAFQIQRLYERDARGGSRYTETVRSHFGVTSPDARLQRVEFLGSQRTMVNVTPIPQNSGTGAYSGTPQGNLAGVATASMSNVGFVKSFTEHCVIMGLVNVRSDVTYQQGIPRMFSRKTRFDFYWPALSHIGEQAILNKEIFAQGTTADEDVFAYQERYGEYRYKPSIVTGEFRSNFATSLDTWHLAQDFAALPVLNQEFIESNTPIDRAIAVPSEPSFIFDSYFKLKCARPMPLYGVPGMIDHF